MRVMLVDDHPLFLAGLRYLLETHGIEVAGTAGSGSQAVDRIKELAPDIVLLDIEMPGGGGIEAIRPLKAALPGVKIVLLTSFADDANLFEAVRRGASGYLLKNLQAEELLALLRTLEQGEAPLAPGLAARLLAEFARQAAEPKPAAAADRAEPGGRLTQRQTEVLDLVAQGKTYKEVGAALGLSERTVKYHMDRILELLRLENRAQAIAYAGREGADNQ